MPRQARRPGCCRKAVSSAWSFPGDSSSDRKSGLCRRVRKFQPATRGSLVIVRGRLRWMDIEPGRTSAPWRHEKRGLQSRRRGARGFGKVGARLAWKSLEKPAAASAQMGISARKEKHELETLHRQCKGGLD